MTLQQIFLGRRIIAYNISNSNFPLWLESIGNDDYQIYFNSKEKIESDKTLSGEILHYNNFTSIDSASGDILLLEGDAVKYIKNYTLLKKFERIYLRTNFVNLLFFIYHLIRYSFSGLRIYPSINPFVTIDKQLWLHMIVRKTARKREEGSPRIYMNKNMSVNDLFFNLNKNNINYVVLRWWDKLPNISINKDIDILVTDEDHDYFIKNIAARKRKEAGIAIDVYTITGNKHSAAEVTYYEPDKAREILSNTRTASCGCKIPSLRNSFMALAYHALYHKGFNAGIKSKYNDTSDHNKFQQTLTKQMAELKIEIPFTMEALDAYLHLHGWRPPADKLSRLATRNQWIQKYFFGENGYLYKQGIYIGAFVLRQDCVNYGGIDFALDKIKESGFEIIKTVTIEPEKIIKFAEKMRGGNWENNILPKILVVVSDNTPVKLSDNQRKKYPFLDNAKMLCKLKIRRHLDKKYKIKSGHWLHGCDNITEAKEYITEIDAGLANELYK